MSLPTVIIFDLDDTLIDTSAVFHTAKERFVAIMISQGFTEQRVRELWGPIEDRNLIRFGYFSERIVISMREAYETLTEELGVIPSPKALRDIALTGSKCLYSMPKPLPHAKRLVAWCAKQSRLALLTRGGSGLQAAKVESLGVRHHFAALRVVERKTTEVFRQMAETMGVAPEQCVSVGDSMRFDVLTALEAGMKAVHVVYPHPEIQWEHDKAVGIAGPVVHRANGLQELRSVLTSVMTESAKVAAESR